MEELQDEAKKTNINARRDFASDTVLLRACLREKVGAGGWSWLASGVSMG
jgi:hypothetical protein